MRTGVQRVVAEPALLPGERIGLVTNYTAVLPDLTPGVAALLAAGVPVRALFGPEHGLRGSVQAGSSEPDTIDPASGLPVFDTYLADGAALDALIGASGVDSVAFDLADIGSRFYTYIWTMYDVIASCGRLGLPFTVLDRPNPIGGTVAEGPLLDPAFASFVGRAAIPIRHGLTAGELAVRFGADLGADVGVITVDGWRRAERVDRTGAPWVMPSANIPTPDTALCYPGTCLFEGTNASEGRGTTRPFELVGAPYVDARWAASLPGMDLPGVLFRDTWFTPTFHKHAGVAVRGVQVHVTDPDAFRPVATAVAMLYLLRVLYPDDVGWLPFLDKLWGSDRLRRRLEAGEDPRDLVEAPAAPVGPLLY